MTETVTEAVPAENVETPEVEAVPAEPILAAITDADTFTQGTLAVLIPQMHALNEVRTRNAGKTKGLDEIIADLKETSQNEKVVALRNKRNEIDEAIAKSVTDEAKAIKADAGEPDLETEKALADAVSGLQKALKSFKDGGRVQHFLPELVSGVTRVSGTTAKTGPSRDLSAVRVWARANGFPDVKDKGRMADDIVDAYDKAHSTTPVAAK